MFPAAVLPAGGALGKGGGAGGDPGAPHLRYPGHAQPQDGVPTRVAHGPQVRE